MNQSMFERGFSLVYRICLPSHLGRIGLNNYCNMDRDLLIFLVEKLRVKSVLDVGCANGAMVKVMRELGLNAYGIDGDFLAIKFLSDKCVRNFLSVHDYQTGNFQLKKPIDLIWSIEFLEHVNKKYLPYILQDFQRFGRYVVISTPPPNSPGYHHVNCQTSEYWIKKFQSYGFKFLNSLTDRARVASKMSDRGKFVDYFKDNGFVFKNMQKFI